MHYKTHTVCDPTRAFACVKTSARPTIMTSKTHEDMTSVLHDNTTSRRASAGSTNADLYITQHTINHFNSYNCLMACDYIFKYMKDSVR